MATETLPALKACTKCLESKPNTSDFYSKARRGFRAQCKNCVNSDEKLRREKNPDRGRDRSAAWYAANKERKNLKSSEWYAANRGRVASGRLVRIAKDHEGAKKRYRDWANKRYSEDPRFRVNTCISSHIRKALKKGKGGKRWQELVGYSLDDLIVHLERQFLKGMAWENFGTWHIDHIVPKASFCFEDAESPGFRACWALSNLRPLWAEDNFSKSKSRLHLL